MEPTATEMENAGEPREYDQFLGQFVDAVQDDGSGLEHLRQRWLDRCPAPWRDQFEGDAAEIEELVAHGCFARDAA